MDVETPELDKQSEIIHSGKAATVQDFIDWLLDEKQYVIAEWSDPDPDGIRDQELFPVYTQREQLMADFFGIDRDKIESERRAILAALQEEQS